LKKLKIARNYFKRL